MTWFGLGKKKSEPDPRGNLAFKKGQEAQAMAGQLDSILASRYGHVKPGFLKVLSDGFDRDMEQEEHSPLLCARANFTVYVENVAERVPDMRSDMLVIMGDWRDGFAEMGLPTAVEEVLNARLGDWQLDMQTSGMKLMMDRADEFKAIDDRWRRKYPDRAKVEPLD